MQILVLLVQTHLGKETDACGLERWMNVIKRDKSKLWSGNKEIVRDFRETHSFFEIVLDANIIGDVAARCGFSSVEEFMSGMSTLEPAELRKHIEALADDLSDFTRVNRSRSRDAAEQDLSYQSHFLLMQHGLVLRNLSLAMRQGDSGRVLLSLIFLTIWFQSSGQFNYANETIHLTACFKLIWSDRLKDFWMRNCLINLSGRRDAFMACDLVCEHVVREVKNMMHHNVNEATMRWLREILSPQIMMFYLTKARMNQETDYYEGHHSSVGKTCNEVRAIVNVLLSEGLCDERVGRENNQKASKTRDLHADGFRELSQLTRINEYIKRVDRSLMKIGVEEIVESEADQVRVDEDMREALDDEDSWLDARDDGSDE
jgi:hypothetical protein